jgi:hypothetical protein
MLDENTTVEDFIRTAIERIESAEELAECDKLYKVAGHLKMAYEELELALDACEVGDDY